MTGGKLFHPASSSANIGSIAALFAAPFPESLDFPVESAIVRPLSWALKPRKIRETQAQESFRAGGKTFQSALNSHCGLIRPDL